MATIGTFKPAANGEYVGEIFTLSMQATGVRIIRHDDRAGDDGPSHLVMVGRAEIGIGWTKKVGDGGEYLALKLDDPSFTAPIHADLISESGQSTFSLVWQRQQV